MDQNLESEGLPISVPGLPRLHYYFNMTKLRLFGLILIIIAALIAIETTLEPKWSGYQRNPTESKFLSDFEKHMKILMETKSLAQQLESVQFIKYRFHSSNIKNLLGNQSLPVPIHPTGKYALESDFIEIPSQENDQFILQLSLVDIESNNKIWENSENYQLSIKPKTNKKTRLEN